ncbi:MAG TPA: sigma-70 family RNA polymerase sigma factor, partial [Ktedonobacterales bacterium]
DERRRWLFRAAYHRALTQLRRRKIIRWASLDWPGSGERDASGPERIELTALAGAVGSLGSFEERIAEKEALRAALARLRPEDAACLLLRVAQGFSAAETADALGTTVEAVAQRLSRARRRLRTIYLEQNPQERAHGERSAGDE